MKRNIKNSSTSKKEYSVQSFLIYSRHRSLPLCPRFRGHNKMQGLFSFFHNCHLYFYEILFSPLCLLRENGYGLGCHQQQRKPILRVSGKYRTVPSAQALQDQACIGPERAKYKYDTCCWPWVFRKSSRLPLLVLSVLFCCRCFSLEAADAWRTLPMLVCPP